ncbi:substrate-binding periplasmic protein [Bdellovibrio bacteriovorus]|uniref:substrate-binding periplasmic protein n=1 Tax=Bdellovibrio bacteriovorus TaxID=959 RepID=UPI003CFC60BE
MRLLWIVLALLCYSIVTSAAQVIEMISPYDNPPFVVDQKKEQGLVYDLASLLTVRSQGKYQFKVVVVPRARLQKMLLRSGVYVVPLVSPKWFGDENEKKYLWTSALMEDENLVLSPRKRALEYENSASLQGKRTSIVLGHAIEPLDQLEKGGTVKTESTQSLNNGLRMLARGRIDFMVMGRMVAIYLIRDLGLEDEIHISDKSLERFDRKIMVSPQSQKELHKWLEGEIQRLRRSGQWKKYLRVEVSLQNHDVATDPQFI